MQVHVNVRLCQYLFLTLHSFLIPVYKCLPEDGDLSLKHVCVGVCVCVGVWVFVCA